MKGKRKVQGRKQRGEAVTTKRIPMGALSPGNRNNNCQMSGKEGEYYFFVGFGEFIKRVE